MGGGGDAAKGRAAKPVGQMSVGQRASARGEGSGSGRWVVDLVIERCLSTAGREEQRCVTGGRGHREDTQ